MQHSDTYYKWSLKPSLLQLYVKYFLYHHKKVANAMRIDPWKMSDFMSSSEISTQFAMVFKNIRLFDVKCILGFKPNSANK